MNFLKNINEIVSSYAFIVFVFVILQINVYFRKAGSSKICSKEIIENKVTT